MLNIIDSDSYITAPVRRLVQNTQQPAAARQAWEWELELIRRQAAREQLPDCEPVQPMPVREYRPRPLPQVRSFADRCQTDSPHWWAWPIVALCRRWYALSNDARANIRLAGKLALGIAIAWALIAGLMVIA